MNFPVEIEIDSRLELAATAGKAAQDACAALSLSEQAGYQVRTCVVEAVNNAILHAYDNQPGWPVTVHFAVTDDALVIEVRDCGRSMPASPAAPEPKEPADLDCLTVGGRGWSIMRAWMDDATYETVAGTNIVRLVKRIRNPDRD